MWIRTLALIVVVAFTPLAARAQSLPAYEGTMPAPETYAKLPWKFGPDLKIGYWYSDKQVIKIKARLDYLEQNAAKECVDTQIAANKPGVAGWIWFVTGAVVAGVATWQGIAWYIRAHPSTIATPVVAQ